MTTNTFEEAVLKAVNLGDDTDTVGALTGGLAGIIYRDSSIPDKWIDNLQRKDYLSEVVNLFINYLEKIKNARYKN